MTDESKPEIKVQPSPAVPLIMNLFRQLSLIHI